MLAVAAVGHGHFIFFGFALGLEPAEFLEPGRVKDHAVLLARRVVLAHLGNCRFDEKP